MSDLASRILKFNSLDLESYLNETIPRYERFLLETEKHNISKIEHEIDTELFKTFLLNSNNLLNILNVYEESYKIVATMVDLSKELIRLRLSSDEEEETLVDEELVKKFRLILDDFSNDTDVFATEGRYLIHFDILEEKCGEKCILVLTNDILVIGKVQTGTKKYRLLNAYSYSIIQLDVEDDLLRIRVDPNVYVFKKDKDSISEILRIYQELTYKHEKEDKDVEEPCIDEELIEYLVFTEQYECIESQGFHCPMKAGFHDKEEILKYLTVAARFGCDISPYVYSFLEERFGAGLMRINRVQMLNSLIEDVFGYFNRFFDEQNKLIAELNKIGEIRRSGLVLLVERELKRCFEVLESRVFNKEFEVKCMESSLKLIKQKLKFSKCDFSYLMDCFLNSKNKYKERCLDSAMRDIERILNDMVSE